ncbi:hypothetical protein OEZ86_011866 [Tetradesmus obliquus]|uniref:Sm domain-containing protein n=1 Tax=Tetradesmus obliquus TaxID=3088 RepID=A0ABY8TJK0_TETOB|nr:hypothetical protein OEZ85_008691 [Tetradesmus obliquus]WIA29361.1 hypothetical protein OEZ86_011866 [Tetradesmus obliquus]
MDYPPPGTALVEELDQKLLIQLRDGRKIIGVLRSFDQFANMVLEHAVERIIVDPGREVPPGLQQVSEAEIRTAIKAEKEEARLKGTMRARMDFLDLD